MSSEVLALKNAKDTCILTGMVSNIVNTTYGNLYLADETDTVYVYGVLTPEGAAKQFATLGVEVNDTLTIKAIYGEFNNAPQITNAIFVSVAKAPVVAADTVEITITEGLEWQDFVDEDGWWQIYGKNEVYAISLSNNFTTEVAGIYTVEDLDPNYSYVLEVNSTDTIKFTDGAVAVAVEETGIVTVAGELLGIDGKIYKITLVCDPSVVDPYKYDEEEAEFVYDFESYQSQVSEGVAVVQAHTDTTMIVLDIILQEGQTALTAGEYEVVAIPAYGTVLAGAYDGELNPSLAATLIEQGGDLYYNEIWYLVSGKVTIDEQLNITVDALNSNGKAIKANLKGDKTAAIDNTAVAGKAVKTIKNGQLIIEKAGKSYNVLGTRL